MPEETDDGQSFADVPDLNTALMAAATVPAEAPQTAPRPPQATAPAPAPAEATGETPPPTEAAPAELPADVLENPQVKAWREAAERAERYAPTLTALEQRGITDSQALARQEQQSADQQRLNTHFEAKFGEFYNQALGAPNAELDAAVQAGEVSEEYAQRFREISAQQQAQAQIAQYQGQVTQQMSEQRAAEEQFSREAAALCARDEYKVGGEPLDATLFNAFASAMPESPLEDVAKALHQHESRLYDRALTAARASEAKRKNAPPVIPGNGAHSPTAPPATDWRNPGSLGAVLAAQH